MYYIVFYCILFTDTLVFSIPGFELLVNSRVAEANDGVRGKYILAGEVSVLLTHSRAFGAMARGRSTWLNGSMRGSMEPWSRALGNAAVDRRVLSNQ